MDVEDCQRTDFMKTMPGHIDEDHLTAEFVRQFKARRHTKASRPPAAAVSMAPLMIPPESPRQPRFVDRPERRRACRVVHAAAGPRITPATLTLRTDDVPGTPPGS